MIETGYERFNPTTLLNHYGIEPKNLIIISGQPFGRSSLTDLNNIYTNIDNKRTINLLFKGLINMKNEHEIKIMNYYTSSLFFEYYKNTGIWNNAEIKRVFPKDKEIKTSSDVVNYLKYNYKNYPEKLDLVIDSEEYRKCPRGIFEVSPNSNKNEIQDINKLLTDDYHKILLTYQNLEYNHKKRQFPTKTLLGLNLDNSNLQKYKKILKYNTLFYSIIQKKMNQLFYLNKIPKTDELLFTIDDVLSVILQEGNIQPNEKIMLITNFCRPIEKTSGRAKQGFNNALNQSNKQIEKKSKLRRQTSRVKVLKSLAPSK